MSYADFTKVSQLLVGEVKLRPQKRLFDTCAEKADAVINAYLSVIYSVPFATPIPELVEHIAQDLTIYYLLRSNFFAGVAANTEDARIAYRDDAKGLLKSIVRKDIVLPDVPSSEEGKQNALLDSTTMGYHSVFDEGDPLDWEVDSARLTAIKATKS